MCTLPLLAGENVGHRFVVPTVASSIDLVVHITTERDGRRVVSEIVAIPGRVEGTSSRAPTSSSPEATGWCVRTGGRRTPTVRPRRLRHARLLAHHDAVDA